MPELDSLFQFVREISGLILPRARAYYPLPTLAEPDPNGGNRRTFGHRERLSIEGLPKANFRKKDRVRARRHVLIK